MRISRGAGLAALCVMLAGRAVAGDVVVHAGAVFDGRSGEVLKQRSIIIHDDRIAAVEQGYVTRPGATVVDLEGYTVLPGLIDVHDHLASSAPGGVLARVTQSQADRTVMALSHAAQDLTQGFTTVRDLNSDGEAVLAARRAIERGEFPGARILTALEALGPTGGHSDPEEGLGPGVTVPDRAFSVADGPEQVAFQVRDHKRRGADLIKLFPGGGVLTPGDDPEAVLMSSAELEAAVSTAHALGLKVAAHAHGKAVIDAAVRAGVDSIEHGTLADVASLQTMAAHGTWLVPTPLVASDALGQIGKQPERYSADIRAKAAKFLPLAADVIGLAVKQHVNIAFGTDKTAAPGSAKARQFARMVQTGMSPRAALLSAMGNAARLLGREGQVGVIAAGAFADMVAVKGDPLAHIELLERMSLVMKGGKVVRDEREVAP